MHVSERARVATASSSWETEMVLYWRVEANFSIRAEDLLAIQPTRMPARE